MTKSEAGEIADALHVIAASLESNAHGVMIVVPDTEEWADLVDYSRTMSGNRLTISPHEAINELARRLKENW